MIELWIGLGSAAIAWLAKYLIDSRKTSGRVSTTDANKLWEEARDLRRAFAQQGRDCQMEVEKLELEVFRLRIENHGLRNDIMKMQFINHPEISEELKADLLSRQEDHVQALIRTYADLQKRVERHITENGGDV